MKTTNKIVLGKIVGVHGLKGNIKIKTFMESPEQILLYKSLGMGATKDIKLKKITFKNDILLCSIDIFNNRSEAENSIGKDIWVNDIDLINYKELGYYHKELLGIEVRDVKGNNLGKIKAIYNFGAGDVIELDSNYPSMIRFDKNNIGEINIEKNYMIFLLNENL